MTRWTTALLAALPGLLLAGLGLAHPHHLGTDTAAQWWQLHVVLLPLFPLLAVVLWWLLRGERGPLVWAARVAAYTYATFYTALDALAGIAAGYAVQSIGEPTQATLDLRSLGNDLGTVGAYAVVAAVVLTVVVLVRRDARAAPGARGGGLVSIAAGQPRTNRSCTREPTIGAVLLILGAVPFAVGHVYWPVGGIGLLAFAAGSALVAAARSPVPAGRADLIPTGGARS